MKRSIGLLLGFAFVSITASAYAVDYDEFDRLGCLVRCIEAGAGSGTCEYICG
jgi:hypothetical protein